MAEAAIAGTLWDEAIWDEDVYEAAISTTGVYSTPGFCPADYLRFKFSGVNLGEYIFEINPTSYNVYPQRDTSAYSMITDTDPTIDKSYIKHEINISWNRISQDMWAELEAFARKRVDGTSEDLYFWDGSIGRFSCSRVKIERLRGEVLGGRDPIERDGVSFMLREV